MLDSLQRGIHGLGVVGAEAVPTGNLTFVLGDLENVPWEFLTATLKIKINLID